MTATYQDPTATGDVYTVIQDARKDRPFIVTVDGVRSTVGTELDHLVDFTTEREAHIAMCEAGMEQVNCHDCGADTLYQPETYQDPFVCVDCVRRAYTD